MPNLKGAQAAAAGSARGAARPASPEPRSPDGVLVEQKDEVFERSGSEASSRADDDDDARAAEEMLRLTADFETFSANGKGCFDMLQEREQVDSLMQVLPLFLKGARSAMSSDAVAAAEGGGGGGGGAADGGGDGAGGGDLVSQLRWVFNEFDLDDSGTLDASELMQARNVG